MLLTKGIWRYVFLICTVVLVIGVVVTFSRGGFLGLAGAGGVLMWKLGRGNRILAIFAAIILFGVFVVATPGGYGSRLLSISEENLDSTGSSWERKELLKRAFEVAVHHPIIGVGMNNFHIFSIKEKVAHNSYVEIWAELGTIGLLAYLILIIAPMRSLIRVEKETVAMLACTPSEAAVGKEFYLLSVGLQATFTAYLISSFFGSIQYLWHIYYLAGYGVTLRIIWMLEKAVISGTEKTVEIGSEHIRRRIGAGILWKSHRLHSEFK